MSQFKGILGAIPLVIVMIFSILMFMLVTITLQALEQKVKTNIKVGIETDDRGTMALSAMQSGKGGVKNIESLDIANALKTLLEKIRQFEGRSYSIKIVQAKNPRPEYSIDVPLQGGMFASLQIKAE